MALHYLGEGESVNYASAKEMGEPTARFFTERQAEVCAILLDLVSAAYRRKVALGLAVMPGEPVERAECAGFGGDLQLSASTTEVARADNLVLAQAARNIVQALSEMSDRGWIDDATAARLAFKFAGEALAEDEIEGVLGRAGKD